MFYVLHGDQEFLLAEEVTRLKDQIREDGMGDLNITTLDGRSLTLPELLNACNTLPFFTQRRLIVVEDYLQRLQSGRGRKRSAEDKDSAENADAMGALLVFVPQVPPSTRLVFVEHQVLPQSHPLLKLVERSSDGYAKALTALEGGALQRWAAQRAEPLGVQFARGALERLVTSVGSDLRALDSEVAKLAAYADYQGTITEEMVSQLVDAAVETNIFGLVDAVGSRQRKQALEHLHNLLSEGANELYILSMIARQVRLLIGVKELGELEHHSPDAIGKRLHIGHRFIVDKLLRQAHRFKMEELERLLARVLDVDQAIKTGHSEGALALEMLVLQSC